MNQDRSINMRFLIKRSLKSLLVKFTEETLENLVAFFLITFKNFLVKILKSNIRKGTTRKITLIQKLKPKIFNTGTSDI